MSPEATDFLKKITGFDEEAAKEAQAAKPTWLCLECKSELLEFHVSGPVAFVGLAEDHTLLYCEALGCSRRLLVAVGGIQKQ